MTQQPIVVGFDDSAASRKALGWALRTAQGRGADVLLVHAAMTFPPMLAGHWTYVASPREIATEAGEEVLQAGRLLAASLAPDVTISSRLVEDAPAAGIRQVAAGAGMVVVGSRGLGGFAELVIGSTSLKVATHASCPVVVVRDETPGLEPGPEARRIVVGIDDIAQTSSDVLSFAFEEASSRRTGLTVLHAWREPFFDLPGKGAPIPKLIQVEEFQADRHHWLAEHLAGWQDKYPDVDVKVVVLAQDPAAALVAASTGAELLVTGTQGHGGPHAVRMLGSVTHAVLHHAHCPVAVVGSR
jgi:nucleotide-binding universal stress UspA family protein